MTFRKPLLRPVFFVATASLALLIVFAVLFMTIHPQQANAAGISNASGTNRVVKITTNSQGTFAFSPLTLKITLGTTVTWKNLTQVSHTVTSNDGKTFNSGILAPGAAFHFKFTKRGTFAYHCSIHPFMMTATVIVS
ncbi:MAG TPA: plastocyanin/azurin family copper-binding protein [Ktedonobacteraceae bacterium]